MAFPIDFAGRPYNTLTLTCLSSPESGIFDDVTITSTILVLISG